MDSPLWARQRPERIEVYRAGETRPLATQVAVPNRRPYLHPLLAPDGVGELTEDAPTHHPWQHGLYVGLNDVNGVGFWTEGIQRSPTDGTFHPDPLLPPTVNREYVSWSVVTEWRAPNGEPLLTETQSWTLRDALTTISLDLRWTLTATVNLRFGNYPYGGLFLRMPYRPETGGSILTSEGLGLPDAEGRRARWVAVSMRVAGRANVAGIAILDHPSNAEHPVPWRVDGQLGISPSRCIAGAWELMSRASTTSRYRVVAFCGETDAGAIEAAWRSWAETR
jgi:hypothetical protein